MTKFKSKFFQQSNNQVIYGVLLIIFTLLAIVLNTVLVLGSSKSNLEASLQRHSLYLAKIFTATAHNDLDNYPELQNKLNLIKTTSSDIANIDILVKKGDFFQVAASFDESKVGQELRDTNYILTWAVDDGIATEILDYREAKKGQKLWEVAMPIYNQLGEKKALLVMQISHEYIYALEKDTLTKSLVVLVVTLIVVLLLLSLNARLFEYAILFKKLKEVDQMKDEFISIASHELRTPITSIKGFLSMLLEGDYGKIGVEGTKALKLMEASVKRLGSLVEDLLNVSRIEQNRLKLASTKVDTKAVLVSITEEFKPRIDEKKLALKMQIPNDLPAVYTDEDKLRQVLVNLVGNSVKYTKKGEIEIIAKQTDPKFVTITIKDTGVGMSAQDREKLFDKFYRVPDEENKDIVGTGLGLWITKQLVKLMGGEIFVDSIKHVGSQFYFTIPIYSGQKEVKIAVKK